MADQPTRAGARSFIWEARPAIAGVEQKTIYWLTNRPGAIIALQTRAGSQMSNPYDALERIPKSGPDRPRFSMPPIGSHVRLVTYDDRCHDANYSLIKRYTVYDGEVLPPDLPQPGNAFRMFDSLNPKWRYPVIPIDEVIWLGFTDGRKAEVAKPVEPEEIKWGVTSSNGKATYVVTKTSHDTWTCTCEGYYFRKSCKHITEKQREYENARSE